MEFYNGVIENPFIPFSNGTESMEWMCNNCEQCVKAYFPKEGNWPIEKTLKSYVSSGKYCKLKYWVDISFLEGSMPLEIAHQIGIQTESGGLKDSCMFFSDKDDDRHKPPIRPKPDRTPDNQLVMFATDEIMKDFKPKLLHSERV